MTRGLAMARGTVKTDEKVDDGTSILDQIGNTPLIRLRYVARDFPDVEVYAKGEGFNPGGSVKDRPALNMIRDGERTGKLQPGGTLIDATSGNTGIAYAMIAAAKGYHVRLFLPANASSERKRILKAYGAEVVLTEAAEGSDGAIRACREEYRQDPDEYFYPDQYNNPANFLAHYDGTGVEIWKQTRGRVTHFVTGLGTSGTFMGVGRRLREYSSDIKLISMQPSSGFHGLEGLKHMETAIVPGIYDEELADENIGIDTEDAYKIVKQLAKEEGLLVGISSGANVAAALKVAARIGKGVIVTVLCDAADKYLSEHFWDEE
jgi:cysteine synthase B